ncbi:MAG: putative quinol monooxygenase [Fuerstiella sp.]
MIVVIATVTCVPGQRDAFLSEFKKIVPEVLNELGCMEYAPTIDEPSSIAGQHCDENRVTIVEKWSDLAALDRHLSAPHMVEYRPKVADFVQATELRVLSASC